MSVFSLAYIKQRKMKEKTLTSQQIIFLLTINERLKRDGRRDDCA
jgi:hypothetical protein